MQLPRPLVLSPLHALRSMTHLRSGVPSLLFPFYSILRYVVHQTSTTLLYSTLFGSVSLYSVIFYCTILNVEWYDMICYDVGQ